MNSSYCLYIDPQGECYLYRNEHDRYKNESEDVSAYHAYLRSVSCGVWPYEQRDKAMTAFKATLTPPSL